MDERLQRLVPDNPTKPYDMKELIQTVLDDQHFFEVQAEYAPNLVVGFGGSGPAGRGRGQPAGAPGGVPRHRRVPQGRPLRPLLRLLQHPPGDVRGRARLPARHRPGVRRHHQARGQAALRLRRGDRAEAHRHHPQGLRRRLLRHVDQAHPRRRELRLPDRRDRRDGPRGGREHPLPARAGGGGRSGALPREERRRVPREVRQPPTWRRSAATSTTSSSPSETRRRLVSALETCSTKRDQNPPRKHGNLPL